MSTPTTAQSVWPRLEPLLTGVRKPARYVGGEDNIVVKDHADTDARWLLIYPDAYEIGQPNRASRSCTRCSTSDRGRSPSGRSHPGPTWSS
jgi:hypothetical protein